MGRYSVTQSPLRTPWPRSQLACARGTRARGVVCQARAQILPAPPCLPYFLSSHSAPSPLPQLLGTPRGGDVPQTPPGSPPQSAVGSPHHSADFRQDLLVGHGLLVAEVVAL